MIETCNILKKKIDLHMHRTIWFSKKMISNNLKFD